MRKRDLYINDDEICEDGQSFRVPLLLCDTARFEPRPLSRLSDLSAADLDRHRPGYRLSDGEASKSTNLTDLDAARDAAQAARDRWIADMCSAWKRPPTHDASEPDAAEQLLARHLRGRRWCARSGRYPCGGAQASYRAGRGSAAGAGSHPARAGSHLGGLSTANLLGVANRANESGPCNGRRTTG